MTQDELEEYPYFLVIDEDTKEIYENGFSYEAMEYYAKQRGNCFVAMIMIDELELGRMMEGT